MNKERLVYLAKSKRIAREQDILLYEELEALKDELLRKLKVIEEALKSDKIFKDLFYSTRGIQGSQERILDELVDYVKKDGKFVEKITGKDAVVDYPMIIREVFNRVRQPEDGKDAVVDYDSIVSEVMGQIRLPKDGKDGVTPMLEEIVDKAVEQITELVPKVEDITDNLPKLGKPIRDALELLKGDERLDKDAIKGLEDLDELRTYLKGKMEGGGAGGSTARSLYQLLDVAISGPTDGQVLTYDSTTSTWKNEAASAGSFADNETPSGTIDGANVTFTLANTPSPAASLQVFLNGAYQTPGGEDFTLSTATVTFVNAPLTGSILRVHYRY